MNAKIQFAEINNDSRVKPTSSVDLKSCVHTQHGCKPPDLTTLCKNLLGKLHNLCERLTCSVRQLHAAQDNSISRAEVGKAAWKNEDAMSDQFSNCHRRARAPLLQQPFARLLSEDIRGFLSIDMCIASGDLCTPTMPGLSTNSRTSVTNSTGSQQQGQMTTLSFHTIRHIHP